MTTKKNSVLIVEDESIVALDIEMSLMELGYDVVAKTGSGKEAVQLAGLHRPDIVLMDIMLNREEDGVQTASQISAQFNIPVIFLTALSDPSTLDRVKRTDPFGYITKPYKPVDLRTAIELALFKHQQQQFLKENLNWLDTTLNSIGDPVITTDTDGHVTFLNPAAQALTGWNLLEIIGKPVRQIFNLRDAITFKEVECPVHQAIATGNAIALEGRYLLIRKDGSTLPVGDCVAPIKDGRGVVLGAVLIFQDMTWYEQASQQLKEKIDQLKHSNKDLSSFAYTASHDIQEPLRKIIAFGNLLTQSSSDLDEKQMDYLERMQNATRRMQKFTQDLLKFSQISATSTPLLEKVDLGDIVTGVLSDHEVLIQKIGAIVETDNLPVIEADKLRMEQLFLNLIGNALKFHKKDGTIPLVKITTRRNSDDRWEITIADNGIGFDETHRERIFKPFERLRGHSEYEGNGIGLAICWEIVASLGGHIAVKSQPGKGSSFTVTLPEKQNLKH